MTVYQTKPIHIFVDPIFMSPKPETNQNLLKESLDLLFNQWKNTPAKYNPAIIDLVKVYIQQFPVAVPVQNSAGIVGLQNPQPSLKNALTFLLGEYQSMEKKSGTRNPQVFFVLGSISTEDYKSVLDLYNTIWQRYRPEFKLFFVTSKTKDQRSDDEIKRYFYSVFRNATVLHDYGEALRNLAADMDKGVKIFVKEMKPALGAINIGHQINNSNNSPSAKTSSVTTPGIVQSAKLAADTHDQNPGQAQAPAASKPPSTPVATPATSTEYADEVADATGKTDGISGTTASVSQLPSKMAPPSGLVHPDQQEPPASPAKVADISAFVSGEAVSVESGTDQKSSKPQSTDQSIAGPAMPMPDIAAGNAEMMNISVEEGKSIPEINKTFSVTAEGRVENQPVYAAQPSAGDSTDQLVAVSPPPSAQPAVSSQVLSAEEVKQKATVAMTMPQREPAIWEEKAPPDNDPDPKKNQDHDSREGNDGWRIVGASQRGQMHAHEGTFREDDFRIEAQGSTLLVAVADGAGSCELSRVGSKLAVAAAMKVMAEKVKDGPPKEEYLKFILSSALKEAWDCLWTEAETRKAKKQLRKKDGKEISFKDLSTTLLLLIYIPEHRILGVAQVGDGLLFLEKETGEPPIVLGYPESGEYSGLTYFLTSSKKDVLDEKIRIYTLNTADPRMICVMTDGVSDDIFPPVESLKGLIKPLQTNLSAGDDLEEKEAMLLKLLQYKRSGSFDDRTLVVVYNIDKLKAAQLKMAAENPAAAATTAAKPLSPSGETR